MALLDGRNRTPTLCQVRSQCTLPSFPMAATIRHNVRSPNSADRVTYVGTIGSKARRELPGIRAGAKYFPTGHVVFLDRGTLMAQRFDISSRELPGEAFPIAEQVAGGIVTPFSASTNGAFGYVAGVPLDTQLVWYDRKGNQVALAGPKGEYRNAELSRDKKYVAFSRGDPGDIWILDIEKGRTSRLTSHQGPDNSPVWSPEGTRSRFSRTVTALGCTSTRSASLERRSSY